MSPIHATLWFVTDFNGDEKIIIFNFQKGKNAYFSYEMTFLRTAWQPYRLSHNHALCVNLQDWHGLNLVFFSKLIMGGFEKVTVFQSTTFQFKNFQSKIRQRSVHWRIFSLAWLGLWPFPLRSKSKIGWKQADFFL